MTLKEYIENEIIPRYDNFDAAHQRDHVLTVIKQALTISEGYGLDKDMLYAAAAFHDTGLVAGRKTHHLESGKIIREDPVLPQFFSQEQIETIAQAAEDHRASSDHEPRSLYGRVIAEADRVIDPMTIIRRTIQYGLSNYPEKEKEEQYERMLEHIHEKYAEGGYLKLWIKESPNA
ncbi:MAG: HD domain-containing protein, partial [Bacteroidales bacterium]|nr:HD domain-containing protein [Bacteroidales bacterium]